MHILVTGGAGFIGSHLVDALVTRGDRVRILDNLESQVHGGKEPAYLNGDAEFLHGDVRDLPTWERALADIEAIIHCASAVGVAQSQYEIKKYVDANVGGTANMLQCIVNGKTAVRRIIVPASMTSYGEGAYRCATHGLVRPGIRSEAQMTKHDWVPLCPQCGTPVDPVPIAEDAEQQSSTIYALTKRAQEEMILGIAATYGIAATSLRLFNVYGSRQSLNNPYTGVAAIFLSRLLNGNPPVIYEDGLQARDFVAVYDVVRAFLLALDTPDAAGKTFNIGSGQTMTIADTARMTAALLRKDIAPSIPGQYRKGDIRCCVADIRVAKNVLGWEPCISFETGMQELIAWSAGESAEDRFVKAQEELAAHRLRA